MIEAKKQALTAVVNTTFKAKRSRTRVCKPRVVAPATEAGDVVDVAIKPADAVYVANETQLTDTNHTIYAAQEDVCNTNHTTVHDKDQLLINSVMETEYASGYDPMLDFPPLEDITSPAPLIYNDKIFPNDDPFNIWMSGSTSNYPSFAEAAPFENLSIDEDVWKSL